MVSDTLSDAVEQIDEYLAEDWYGGADVDVIAVVRDHMDAVRAMLDGKRRPEEDPLLVAHAAAAFAVERLGRTTATVGDGRH